MNVEAWPCVPCKLEWEAAALGSCSWSLRALSTLQERLHAGLWFAMLGCRHSMFWRHAWLGSARCLLCSQTSGTALSTSQACKTTQRGPACSPSVVGWNAPSKLGGLPSIQKRQAALRAVPSLQMTCRRLGEGHTAPASSCQGWMTAPDSAVRPAHRAPGLQALRRESDSRALVLLDEVGTGTDPVEGAALGAAILRALARGGARGAALTFATTHHRWAHIGAVPPACSSAL